MSVSVVIAARNSASTLAEQLDALLRHSPAIPWEILVVDNASTDATAEIVKQYVAQDDRVRYIPAHDRLGAGHARNTGAAAARYDALAFCDADDVVADGWLAAMAEALADASFVTGPLDVDRLNDVATITARGRWVTQQQITIFDGIFPYASSCNMGVNRAAFDQVGGFDEKYLIGQDVELSMRMWLAGFELSWTAGALVHYRYRSGNRAIWRQGRKYGAVHPAIHARLRAQGLSNRSGVRWRSGAWLVRNAGLLARPAQRGRWLWTAATLVGELQGLRRARRLATMTL